MVSYGVRVTLDMNMRLITSEMESLRDQQTRKQREKDAELRKLKKAEQQLKNAREALQTVEKKHKSVEEDVSLYDLLKC